MKKIKKRGFGSMSKERIKEVARKGGVLAHKNGKAHKWDSKSARLAGIKGGKNRHKKHDTNTYKITI